MILRSKTIRLTVVGLLSVGVLWWGFGVVPSADVSVRSSPHVEPNAAPASEPTLAYRATLDGSVHAPECGVDGYFAYDTFCSDARIAEVVSWSARPADALERFETSCTRGDPCGPIRIGVAAHRMAEVEVEIEAEIVVENLIGRTRRVTRTLHHVLSVRPPDSLANLSLHPDCLVDGEPAPVIPLHEGHPSTTFRVMATPTVGDEPVWIDDSWLAAPDTPEAFAVEHPAVERLDRSARRLGRGFRGFPYPNRLIYEFRVRTDGPDSVPLTSPVDADVHRSLRFFDEAETQALELTVRRYEKTRDDGHPYDAAVDIRSRVGERLVDCPDRVRYVASVDADSRCAISNSVTESGAHTVEVTDGRLEVDAPRGSSCRLTVRAPAARDGSGVETTRTVVFD